MGQCFLSVDPGMNLGWALWDAAQWGKLVPPLAAGCIIPPKSLEWMESVEYTTDRFEQEAIENHRRMNRGIAGVFVEWPQFLESEGGKTAARGGSLVKLVFALGMQCHVCSSRGIPVNQVPLSWKGQISKEETQRRIEERFGAALCARLGIVSHAFDAVGVGLYEKGYF